MSPGIVAKVDAVRDEFEKVWKCCFAVVVIAFLETKVDTDFRSIVPLHLLAVDAEYLRAPDGAVPSPAEYAGLLSVDVGELQQFLENMTRMMGDSQTPAICEYVVPNLRQHDVERIASFTRFKMPKIPGYEGLAELGRGGMGVVYKARQLGAGRLVTIKLMSKVSPHSD